MPDAYTSTTAVANLVQTAVDRYVRAALRDTPLLRSLVDVRPVQPAMPGSTLNLYIYPDLAAATTPLSETVDPDAVALGNPTPIPISPLEYGNMSLATIRLDKFSFSDIAPYQMGQIAWNMRDTLDILVRDVLRAGTNVLRPNGRTLTNQLTAGAVDSFQSSEVRRAVTNLRKNAVQGKRGDLYAAFVTPEQSFDLRKETGGIGWRDAHQPAAPGLIWPGEVGVYEGAFFVETNRMYKANDGAAAATVHRALFLGKEALAEAVAKEPQAEVGVVPDKFNRFVPLGWHGILGWARFREAALYRVETGSTFV